MVAPDPYDADLVISDRIPDLLAVFNRAGVLAPADVHLAARLTQMAGVADDLVGLAVALAGRAPRVGHVSVDLAGVRSSVVVGEEDADLDLLPWPDPAAWMRRLSACPLVSAEADGGGEQSSADRCATVRQPGGSPPLHLVGSRLYLDRYWRDEVEVASELLRRSLPPGPTGGPPTVEARIEHRLDVLFPGEAASDQRFAAATALSGSLAVIAGGPGTGKTTTVARLLAVIAEHAIHSTGRPPLVGLAAPTGKAAARLEEAVRAEASRMAVPAEVLIRLSHLSGMTVHRLLGARPDRTSRFRHDREHRLPHDVVVIDEASMVSLALMARLLEAVRPDARLILVGDPEQLVSVEAGAVLADIVGSAPPAGRRSTDRPRGIPATGDGSLTAAGSRDDRLLAGRIAFLRTNHRFGGRLADLASAVREGDSGAALSVLRQGSPELVWMQSDPAEGSGGSGSAADMPELRHRLVEWASSVARAARAGQAGSALEIFQRHRLLCAHREGPAGVTAWNRRIEQWLADEMADVLVEGSWYAGRPVMVTANDYPLRLFNGDTGVVVAAATSPGPTPPVVVAFPQSGGVRVVSPYRLSHVDTVYATTVHKSQGSEFDRVTLVLPADASRLLSRELMYTAVTRARRALLVVGTETAIRRAVEHRLARGSGLAARLWTAEGFHDSA